STAPPGRPPRAAAPRSPGSLLSGCRAYREGIERAEGSSAVTVLWLAFFGCTAVIVYSGMKLSKYGDIIAEKTGLGGTWVGVVLMASVTSLPELVTGISSITYADVPDIAVGNVLGACVLNMFTLALLDAVHRPAPLSARAHYGHVLAAAFGMLLLSLVVVNLFLDERAAPLGWISPSSLLFILLYFVAIRLIYSYEKRRLSEYVRERAEELRYEKVPLRTALLNYGLNALVVIIAALFLPGIGEGLARVTGLGQTFVGTIFIAVSTTLPELVVSFSAVRMGAVDLAIGNLFGSNIFNILILSIDDLFFTRGPLLAFAQPDHIVSGLSATAMTAVAVIGLTYRAERKRLPLAWDSLGIILIYLMNVMVLYMLR
ncbi:MAG: hypothetical protein AB1805_07165, partial [Nitrospirota bacterium]